MRQKHAQTRQFPLQERELHVLLDSTTEGVCAIDLQGRFTFVNKAAAEMLGYAPADLLGQDMHALVHHARGDGSNYPLAECPIRRTLQTGLGCRIDNEVLWRRNGTAFAAEYSAYPIVREREICGAVVTFSDATARRRDAQRVAQLMARLVALGASLNRPLAVKEVVPAIGRGARALGGTERVAVYLWGPDGTPSCPWSAGLSQAYLTRMIELFKQDEETPAARLMHARPEALSLPGGYVVEGIRSLLFPSRKDLLRGLPQSYHESVAAEGIEALALWPLAYEERTIGGVACYYDRPHTWSGPEQEVFQAFCAQAAVALENARLHEEQVELALTDSLTGLPNHRALRQALEREIARAGRLGHSVSVVVVEIDKFKRINDSVGHLAGDEVLKAVGRALRSACRSMDLAARYGGDEFVLILPEASKADALQVAERLRRTMRDFHRHDALPSRPTVTLGVACSPADGVTAEALLSAADRAMYQAKRAGGDRVGVTQEPV